LQPTLGGYAFAIGTAIGLGGAQLIVSGVVWWQDKMHPYGIDMTRLSIAMWLAVFAGMLVSSHLLKLLILLAEFTFMAMTGVKFIMSGGLLAQLKSRRAANTSEI
jgi:hypothetical protein